MAKDKARLESTEGTYMSYVTERDEGSNAVFRHLSKSKRSS